MKGSNKCKELVKCEFWIWNTNVTLLQENMKWTQRAYAELVSMCSMSFLVKINRTSYSRAVNDTLGRASEFCLGVSTAHMAFATSNWIISENIFYSHGQ